MESAVSSIAWSPDGELVASGSQDGVVEVREATTGNLVLRDNRPGKVSALFIRDKQNITAIATLSNAARLWSVGSPGKVVEMPHKDKVEAVALSSDGKWVASGSWDGTARVWDVETGQPLAEMRYELPVAVLAFGGDGRWLLAGSRDGHATAWLWSVDDLIAMACMGSKRDLRHEQWNEHGIYKEHPTLCP